MKGMCHLLKLYFHEYSMEHTFYGHFIMKNVVRYIHIIIISYNKYTLIKKQTKYIYFMQFDMVLSFGYQFGGAKVLRQGAKVWGFCQCTYI
jgi:hypothetical protein